MASSFASSRSISSADLLRAEPESSSHERPGGSKFCGQYELVATTPTRLIKPALGSKFTAYAFSCEGTILATGEIDGRIRLRSTEDYYTLVGEAAGCFASPVSALSFVKDYNNHVIAVDKKGKLCRFEFKETQQSASAPLGCIAEVLMKIDLANHNELPAHVEVLTHQFSTNGETLAYFNYAHNPETKELRCTHADIFRINEKGIDCQISIVLSYSDFCVPVLSKNGRSLLICGFRPYEPVSAGDITEERCETWVKILPKLDFRPQQPQQPYRLSGQCASWGLDGEYFLLWGTHDKRPRLSIYKTSEFCLCGGKPPSVRSLDLPLGLITWTARILEPSSAENEKLCLIYLITDCKRRILLRWRFEKGLVTEEIDISLRQRREFDRTKYLFAGEKAEQIVECAQPSKSPGAFYYHVMRNAFPNFAASEGREWVGAFSWRRHAGSVASRSGVAVWKFRLPDDLVMHPFRLPVQVMFDPPGGHFMLVGDSAILAFKLPFLQMTDQAPVQRLIFRHTRCHVVAEHERQSLVRSYQVLSSKALAKLYEAENDCRANFPFRDALQVDAHRRRRVVDAALSADGCLLAFIVRESQGTLSVTVHTETPEWTPAMDCFADLRFPMYVPSSNVHFEPDRLFLFDKPNSSGGNALALFSNQGTLAIFCTIRTQDVRVVKLPLRRCLKIVQSEDRNRLVILDIDGVSIMDLITESVAKTVKYKANFLQLIQLVNNFAVWSREDGEHDKDGFDRRISDDGRSVLLGWDMSKRKSIVVTPSMERTECEAMIQEARGSLSESCALCPRALCTSFFDVHGVKEGRITIGIYNESTAKVMYHFNIAENISESLSHDQLRALLSNLFYGISADYETLITATIQLHALLPIKQRLQDKIRTFSLNAEANCLPMYEQLSLKTVEKIMDFFQKSYADHLFFGCCFPLQDGKSIFQTAFLKKTGTDASSEQAAKIVTCIIDLAKESSFQLSLDWTSLNGESSNLLQEALKTGSTNQIKDAVELYCSEVAPFNNAAAFLKLYFQELTRDHCRILEDILSKNLLVTEAQKIDVHVDFMNQELRRDTGLHIGTSNTIFDWIHIKDAKYLENNWRKKNQRKVEKMEGTGNTSTTQASLKFIRIEDAAKTGMNGIIRPLLLQRVPVRFFQYDAVKWIVMFKWFKIWQPRYFRAVFEYFFFLLLFTIYVMLISSSIELSNATTTLKFICTLFMFLNLMFGLKMVFGLFRKMRTITRDGSRDLGLRSGTQRRRREKLEGLVHLFKFRWNCLDFISCFLLILVTPSLHIMSLVSTSAEKPLSVIVAVETLVAFAKVWNYAQPYHHCEQLVRMVYNIARDCLVFLVLASLVLLSFSLALLVLFRHTLPDDAENSQACADAFGTAERSLLTLFYALLGDFDQPVYRSTGKLSRFTTAIFVLYLLTQTLLLLNLLIAIMGDTFDRVRYSEEGHLWMGRAQFIDSSEAELTESQCKEIDDGIDKYLHILLKSGEEYDKEVPTEWAGKLDRIECMIRNVSTTIEANVQNLMGDHMRAVTGEQQRIIAEQVQQQTTNTLKHLQKAVSEQIETFSEQQQKAVTEQFAMISEQLLGVNSKEEDALEKLV